LFCLVILVVIINALTLKELPTLKPKVILSLFDL